MSHAPEPWIEGVEGNFRAYAADGHAERSGPVIEALRRHYLGERRANLVRAVACVNACQGLTPEQVAAISRLVAWYQGKPSDFERHDAWMAEWRELDRIFKTGDES